MICLSRLDIRTKVVLPFAGTLNFLFPFPPFPLLLYPGQVRGALTFFLFIFSFFRFTCEVIHTDWITELKFLVWFVSQKEL